MGADGRRGPRSKCSLPCPDCTVQAARSWGNLTSERSLPLQGSTEELSPAALEKRRRRKQERDRKKRKRKELRAREKAAKAAQAVEAAAPPPEAPGEEAAGKPGLLFNKVRGTPWGRWVRGFRRAGGNSRHALACRWR